MAQLQSVEMLREKFDRERDMYLKHIVELEVKLADGASQKDPTPRSMKFKKDKGDASS